jgi:hypothetical protein
MNLFPFAMAAIAIGGIGARKRFARLALRNHIGNPTTLRRIAKGKTWVPQ